MPEFDFKKWSDCCARCAAAQPGGLGRNLFYGGRISDRCPLRFCTLFRRALLPTQTERAVDQTDMTIGLRKITEHPAAQRTELLSKRAHIIAAQEQAGAAWPMVARAQHGDRTRRIGVLTALEENDPEGKAQLAG